MNFENRAFTSKNRYAIIILKYNTKKEKGKEFSRKKTQKNGEE